MYLLLLNKCWLKTENIINIYINKQTQSIIKEINNNKTVNKINLIILWPVSNKIYMNHKLGFCDYTGNKYIINIMLVTKVPIR